MMNESQCRELKVKMAALKSLYASRHYSQCAKFGELLLSEIHDQTHPLHLAHLNFYTALSHDTLAREATLKNRWKELSLAELHYNTAILALLPLQPPAQCDPWSPNSSTTSPPSPYSRRRSSVSSNRSAASSATSLGDEDNYQTWPESPATRDARHKRSDSAIQSHNPHSIQDTTANVTVIADIIITAPSRPHTPQQFYFTANVASFVRMLESHLADVRDQKQKTSVPTVRFCLPSPRPSPTKARASASGGVRGLGLGLGLGGDEDVDDAAMEAVRESRRNVRFRRRFDAASTRKLCREALTELIE